MLPASDQSPVLCFFVEFQDVGRPAIDDFADRHLALIRQNGITQRPIRGRRPPANLTSLLMQGIGK